jgi:flagellum-specific peptidoglycan hydrolase FlgJ
MDLKVLRNLVEDAKQVYSDYPIMQRVVVSQGIHESHMNSPRGASQLAIRDNNLFGMKAKTDENGNFGREGVDYDEYPTWEHIDGEDKQVRAKFAKFPDHISCFKAHRALMERPRYKPVLESESVEEAFDELRECGYATDPNYPKRLQEVYDSIVRRAFNE